MQLKKNMSDSKKNLRKDKREWKDLLGESKSYLARKQEEREARKALNDFRRHLRQEGDNDYYD